MQIIIAQLSVLYVFLLAGWFVGRIKSDKTSHSDILSVLLVNIFLPCKVFNTFANNFSVSYFAVHYTLPLAAVVLLVVLIVLSRLISRLMSPNKYERKVYGYSVIVTNYSYLGYTLIGTVFGEDMLAQFMLFAIPFIIYTYTLGYSQLIGSKIAIRTLINPITVGIALGISVSLLKLSLPEVVTSVVVMASACVGPISMLLTGLTLSAFSIKEMVAVKNVYLFSALRLVGIPALTYLLCHLMQAAWLLPMMLTITCMPCGLNTIVFPKLVGEDCKVGASLVLVTHVFSIITVPFWLSLMI